MLYRYSSIFITKSNKDSITSDAGWLLPYCGRRLGAAVVAVVVVVVVVVYGVPG